MYLFQSRVLRTVGIIIIIFIFVYGYYITCTTSKNFPVGGNFVVEEDESLRSVSYRLENEHFIRSALWFRVWVSFLNRDRQVQLGGYSFTQPLTLGAVVKKLVYTQPDTPLISVTIPEGSTTYEVAMLVKKVLPNFSIDIFGEKVFAKNADGKLFPSTYFLLPSSNEERILDIMMNTFDKKYTENFKDTEILLPLRNKEDVIVLASILEGEAKTKEDMQKVSGILLKRLSIGMALQVDVAKETYKTIGLPTQPINNPGLVSLYAVLNPINTPYLYYVTGKDGTMHYAKTFTEHKANIKKYL